MGEEGGPLPWGMMEGASEPARRVAPAVTLETGRELELGSAHRIGIPKGAEAIVDMKPAAADWAGS